MAPISLVSDDTLFGPLAPPSSPIDATSGLASWTMHPREMTNDAVTDQDPVFKALYFSTTQSDGSPLCNHRLAHWLSRLPQRNPELPFDHIGAWIESPGPEIVNMQAWDHRAARFLFAPPRSSPTTLHNPAPLVEIEVGQNGSQMTDSSSGDPTTLHIEGLDNAVSPTPGGQNMATTTVSTRLLQNMGNIMTPAPGIQNMGNIMTSAPGPLNMGNIAASSPGVQSVGNTVTASGLQHPNPLGQHPVDPEQHTKLHVTRRFSPLLSQQPSSRPAIKPTSNRGALEDSIVDRFRALHVGHRYGTQMSAQDQTANNANMIDPGDENERVSGSDTKKSQERKRARSITRTASNASQHPSKRLRRTLTTARNRWSRVMTPIGGLDDHTNGRQSRLAHQTEATSLVQVTGFPTGVVKERVKIAFIGNHGVGKTSLLNAFRTSKHDDPETSTTAHQPAVGYEVDTFFAVLDGVAIACEAWDVSDQCEERELDPNAIHPLMTLFFDAVIICHDVSDETSLQAIENKWGYVAERYCPGAPTMVLGLKTDLRKPLPSLRLSHMWEPTQTSRGQGEEMAKKITAEAHYEASAKTGEGVVEFFESTMRYALQRRTRRRGGEILGPVSRAKRAWAGLKGLKKRF